MNAAGRVTLLALAATALVAGIAGGLARMGVAIPVSTAAGYHGALMVAGFLGTVISLERAVALGHRLAYAAPLASGVGTLLLLFGVPGAALAWIAAPLFLLGASIAIVRRQAQIHTVLLMGAALAWLVANLLFVSARLPDVVAIWGFVFLVLTIAAERLEMARLMRPRPLSRPTFYTAAAVLVGGAALAIFRVGEGAIAFGAGLLALAAWLATFDLARRTLRTEGFSRYAAVALLTGYAWLALGGIAWMALPALPAVRDTALHSLGLGFVFSMIFAHGPIVVPVVAKVRLRFTASFYLPLALLHLSLGARLLAGAFGAPWRPVTGIVNAAAIALFVVLLLGSIQRRKASHEARRRGTA